MQAGGALGSRRVTDRRDLEASLAEMDRKLRELQRELALVSQHPQPADPPPPPPAPAPPSPPQTAGSADAIERTAARVVELGRQLDDLQRLREELEEATRALREEHARAAPPPEPEAPAGTFSGDVLLNAGPFPDIATLSAFEHALSRLPGATDAYVRSYEGRRALVDVRLEQPLDLVAELRRTLPFHFDVVAVGRGELTLTLDR
jgi:hypothetical protein